MREKIEIACVLIVAAQLTIIFSVLIYEGFKYARDWRAETKKIKPNGQKTMW